MKLWFGNVFVRLGAAPTETNNFFSIDCGSSTCLLRAAAFAEQFDSALTFYVEVVEGLCELTEACWFELQRRAKRRLPSEIVGDIRRVGYTQHGALFGPIGSDDISSLLNEFWLSDRFRVIGGAEISAERALKLAVPIADRGQPDTLKLPLKTTFAVEKQYSRGEPFLVVLFDNQALCSIRELINRTAVRLKRPLLEVGAGGWPRG